MRSSQHSVWLKGMWVILQSDKGLSSLRLAEALGVSQPTAWRMGHALRPSLFSVDKGPILYAISWGTERKHLERL